MRAMPPGSAVARLLDRSIAYALDAVDGMPAGSSHWPTPCHGWDLRALVDHLAVSAGVLEEAFRGCPVAGVTVAVTGAVEFAVHGWDVNQACGRDRPLPPDLAIELLTVAPLVVPGSDRSPLFDRPVAVGGTATPTDRLVAYCGRDPRSPLIRAFDPVPWTSPVSTRTSMSSRNGPSPTARAIRSRMAGLSPA